MRQVSLEKVIKEGRTNPQMKRTGEKITCMIEGITPEMVGSLIELKKLPGMWVIDIVEEDVIEVQSVKRNYYVG